MPDNRARQRERHEQARVRDARQRRAKEAQRAEAEAAARRALQRTKRRRVEAAAWFTAAIVIAVLHVFEHGGGIRLMSQNLEDLLIGFPTAAIFVLIGFIRLGT